MAKDLEPQERLVRIVYCCVKEAEEKKKGNRWETQTVNKSEGLMGEDLDRLSVQPWLNDLPRGGGGGKKIRFGSW